MAIGNEFERKYLDVDGGLVRSAFGYASWRAKFDVRRKEISRSYFGVDGKPALNNEGIAGSYSAYDARGKVIETGFFDIEGTKLAGEFGYAIMQIEYDSWGRQIVRRFLDAARKPVRASDSGRSIIRTTYDDQNLKVQESSLDERGHLIDRA